MIEVYITVVAFTLFLHGILTMLYLPVCRRTWLRMAGRKFFLNKWFSTTTVGGVKLFWLSTLWLILFYFYRYELCVHWMNNLIIFCKEYLLC